MNYNAPARKKNKKTRMAGGQMVQSQTGNAN